MTLKSLTYCFNREQNAHFHILKLKYNLYRGVYLLRGGMYLKSTLSRFLNFQRFELSRVIFSHGNQELVRVCGSFEQSRC